MLTLTEDIIIQSEAEKQDKNQMSEKKFQNMWDFESKFSNASDFDVKALQRVKVWIEKKYDASDFEKNTFLKACFFEEKKYFWKTRFWRKNYLQKADSEKTFEHKKSAFDSIYHVKRANLAFFVLFWKAQVWWKCFFSKARFWIQYFFQKAWFWMEKFL